MFLITFGLLGYSKMIYITQIHIFVSKKYFSKDFLCKICVLVIAFYCNFFLGVFAENLRGLAIFPKKISLLQNRSILPLKRASFNIQRGPFKIL
jgi:hypothetical protein